MELIELTSPRFTARMMPEASVSEIKRRYDAFFYFYANAIY